MGNIKSRNVKSAGKVAKMAFDDFRPCCRPPARNHDILAQGLNESLGEVHKRHDVVGAGGSVEIIQPRPWYPAEDFTRILEGSWDIQRGDVLSQEIVIVVPGNERNSEPKLGPNPRLARPKGPRPAPRTGNRFL